MMVFSKLLVCALSVTGGVHGFEMRREAAANRDIQPVAAQPAAANRQAAAAATQAAVAAANRQAAAGSPASATATFDVRDLLKRREKEVHLFFSILNLKPFALYLFQQRFFHAEVQQKLSAALQKFLNPKTNPKMSPNLLHQINLLKWGQGKASGQYDHEEKPAISSSSSSYLSVGEIYKEMDHLFLKIVYTELRQIFAIDFKGDVAKYETHLNSEYEKNKFFASEMNRVSHFSFTEEEAKSFLSNLEDTARDNGWSLEQASKIAKKVIQVQRPELKGPFLMAMTETDPFLLAWSQIGVNSDRRNSLRFYNSLNESDEAFWNVVTVKNLAKPFGEWFTQLG